MLVPPHPLRTRTSLRADLEALGLRAGDAVMVHAAMSKVGRLLNGPDALVGALLDAVGPSGTVLAYTDWDATYEELLDGQGHVPPQVAGPCSSLRSGCLARQPRERCAPGVHPNNPGSQA